MIPHKSKIILALMLTAVFFHQPPSLIWGEDVKEGAGAKPASWKNEKSGAETGHDEAGPSLFWQPAKLPPGVIPAKTPVIYPRNQKVRIIPPQPVKIVAPVAKAHPKPFTPPAKAVSLAQPAVKKNQQP